MFEQRYSTFGFKPAKQVWVAFPTWTRSRLHNGYRALNHGVTIMYADPTNNCTKSEHLQVHITLLHFMLIMTDHDRGMISKCYLLFMFFLRQFVCLYFILKPFLFSLFISSLNKFLLNTLSLFNSSSGSDKSPVRLHRATRFFFFFAI